MSRISGRQEPAVDAGWGHPSIALGHAGRFNAGKAIGVVVITLDVNHTFSTLVEDLPREFELYLANSRGDILIHPNQQRTFGFDTGRRTLIQEEFPSLRNLCWPARMTACCSRRRATAEPNRWWPHSSGRELK